MNEFCLMTRYETLMNQAEQCLECAKNTTGVMQSIWLHHHNELKAKANSLTIAEAESEIFLN